MKKDKNKKSKEYFNCWEYSDSKSITMSNPLLAAEKFKQYIEKYPKDYFSYVSYANILLTLGNIKEAENVIKLGSNLAYENINFKNSNKYRDFLESLNYVLLRLLAYNENYTKLYEYCINNPEKIRKSGLSSELLFSKIKCGLINENEISKLSYKASQLFNYDEKLFLEHEKKHLKSEDSSYDTNISSVFNIDFPFEKVLKEIKRNINLDNKYFYGFFEDKYFFRYDGCGEAFHKNADYFEVITIHNTNNILTIYPSLDGKFHNNIDLNYILFEDVPTRKLSQIDKFNMRYKK